MESAKKQDSIDIRKTQISKEIETKKDAGWFEDVWHVVLLMLGVLTFLIFLLLFLWQSGGIDGLANVWLSKTESEISSVPENQKFLLYKNTNLGIGFEHTPNYIIEQIDLDTVKVTSDLAGEQISVLLMSLRLENKNGELGIDCGKYIENCKKLNETQEEFVAENQIDGYVSELEVMISKDTAFLRVYTLDIYDSKFRKLYIFPTTQKSNILAEEISGRILLTGYGK